MPTHTWILLKFYFISDYLKYKIHPILGINQHNQSKKETFASQAKRVTVVLDEELTSGKKFVKQCWGVQ